MASTGLGANPIALKKEFNSIYLNNNNTNNLYTISTNVFDTNSELFDFIKPTTTAEPGYFSFEAMARNYDATGNIYTAGDLSLLEPLTAIAYEGCHMVAVGKQGAVFVSADRGTNWRRIVVGNSDLTSVCLKGNIILIGNANGQVITLHITASGAIAIVIGADL